MSVLILLLGSNNWEDNVLKQTSSTWTCDCVWVALPKSPVCEVSSHIYLFTYWMNIYNTMPLPGFVNSVYNAALRQWPNRVKCIVLLKKQLTEQVKMRRNIAHRALLDTVWVRSYVVGCHNIGTTVDCHYLEVRQTYDRFLICAAL